MAVILAFGSAAMFALGTVLQQRVVMDAPEAKEASAGILFRLIQHPVWLAGVAAYGIAFGLQAAALGDGRLVVVQPILATTIVFALRSTPGSLFKALSVFALRDINLTKLESRPVRGAPWEYLFYAEVEANRDDLTFGRSLTHLAEFARWTRVLGTYKGAERRVSEQDASTSPLP